mmetsp:Transcript_89843/g.254589  ORF Transcript_89843/g.254589 Transcript_89843/m.254589 type:complete len:208 (+) Transcript_89843:1679-2302(+)
MQEVSRLGGVQRQDDQLAVGARRPLQERPTLVRQGCVRRPGKGRRQHQDRRGRPLHAVDHRGAAGPEKEEGHHPAVGEEEEGRGPSRGVGVHHEQGPRGDVQGGGPRGGPDDHGPAAVVAVRKPHAAREEEGVQELDGRRLAEKLRVIFHAGKLLPDIFSWQLQALIPTLEKAPRVCTSVLQTGGAHSKPPPCADVLRPIAGDPLLA